MESYLNYNNIERSAGGIEYHPLIPFLPQNCRILFLGSFPPQRKRWAKGFDFFYPNFINDHWRIEGQVFFNDKNHFVDEVNKTFRLPDIVTFLQDKGIGFYDTATAVRRLNDNASDKFLEIVEPTDISRLTESLKSLRAIITTGEKATETICRYYGLEKIPKVGEWVRIELTIKKSPRADYRSKEGELDRVEPMPGIERPAGGLELYRLPSSSRAYPLALEKKAEVYRKMFERYL